MGKEKNTSDDIPFIIKSMQQTTVIALSIISVSLCFAFIGLAFFTAELYVQKEKTPEPIIFEVDKTAHKIIRVEKGNLNVTKQSLLRSITLREYVFNRETINHIDEKIRWKKIKLMSNKNVNTDFQTMMNPKINAKSPFANKDFKRRIEIITDYPLDKNNNVHRVEYYLTDTIGDDVLPTQRFVAVIQYDISDAHISWSDRFINIDGIVIVRYEIYGA